MQGGRKQWNIRDTSISKNLLTRQEGKSITPSRDTFLSFVQSSNLICLGLEPLKKFFVQTQYPSSALDLTLYAACRTAQNLGQHQVWRARRGGLNTMSRTSHTNLDCVVGPLITPDLKKTSPVRPCRLGSCPWRPC